MGGGPAGMEAAWYAAALGHHVTLLEAPADSGGSSRWPSRCLPARISRACERYRERMLARHGVTVRLGVAATVAAVLACRPDVVIVATGSHPAGAAGTRGAEWAFDGAQAEPGRCLVWTVTAR